MHVLIDQLPSWSRFKAKLGGDDEGHRWRPTDHLLAEVTEGLQMLRNAILATAPGRRRGKLPKIQRHPRPGDIDKSDVTKMKSSLAYDHLRQLRPGGPVAQGQPLTGPLVVNERNEKE